jgi:succinyl-CoA synthetase beta subunit
MVGTNQDEGRKILQSAGLTAMDKMDDAARLAVSKVAA